MREAEFRVFVTDLQPNIADFLFSLIAFARHTLRVAVVKSEADFLSDLRWGVRVLNFGEEFVGDSTRLRWRGWFRFNVEVDN